MNECKIFVIFKCDIQDAKLHAKLPSVAKSSVLDFIFKVSEEE